MTLRSMTGFGRGAAGEGDSAFAVTVQGWNLRHLDLQIRLPEELRELESELRARAQSRLARGRCEVQVRRGVAAAVRGALVVDPAAVRDLRRQLEPLVSAGAVRDELTVGDLVRSSLVERGEPAAPDPGAAREPLLAAFDEALAAFDAERTREGAQIAAVLEEAVGALRRHVAELSERHAVWSERLRERTRARLDEILPGGADAVPDERLALEVLLLAERSDVREELDRLASHLGAYDEVVAGPGPHGKRLDFWSQEILRELNTLGAKSRDAEVTKRVVDAKVINEQLREQVQNVE